MIGLKHMVVAPLALSMLACGSRAPVPSDPSATIDRFMEAVQAEDYAVLGQLWGTDRGPAARWMDADELRKRLTVMQGFLIHRSYEVMPGAPRVSSGGRLIVQVRIVTPNNCRPVVPFTVVPFRGEWLIEVVDLPAVQPTQRCA